MWELIGGRISDPGGAGGLQLMADLDAFARRIRTCLVRRAHPLLPFLGVPPRRLLGERRGSSARQKVALATGPTADLPHLNPAVRDKCLDQIRQVVGACSDSGYPDVVAPQCQWVFTKGKTPLGGACKSDGDCAPLPDQPPLCLNATCGQADDQPASGRSVRRTAISPAPPRWRATEQRSPAARRSPSERAALSLPIASTVPIAMACVRLSKG